MHSIDFDSNTFVCVLTGAGVSAESGIPTFRGAGGLWNEHPVETVASPDGFARDPALVWQFYSERRATAKSVAPNAGHVALAKLEARLGDRMLLVTQNIDGLHQRAGSRNVIELHGSLWKTRCSVCDRAPIDDDAEYSATKLPGCGRCHQRGAFALLRPHIVWFGERLDVTDIARVEAFFERARGGRFLYFAIGTSGTVAPAAQLVEQARARGASTWLVNTERPVNADDFDHVVLGSSAAVLPSLLG